INKTPYLIGRSKRNVDFSINSNSVSRKHCVIEYIDNDFYISDIGSSNGTRVNNVKLINNEKKKLSFDDRIKLGEVVFFFRK
ncbi:MAG: FHA domain-containing protein, partial [Eubacterium sp.]